MNRAEVFYRLAHSTLGIEVEKDDKRASIAEYLILVAIMAGNYFLEEQQRAEAERTAQLAEVVR